MVNKLQLSWRLWNPNYGHHDAIAHCLNTPNWEFLIEGTRFFNCASNAWKFKMLTWALGLTSLNPRLAGNTFHFPCSEAM